MNPNMVVYSLILGSDIGDFSFNWLGLYDSTDNVLVAVSYSPLTDKLKYEGNQVGNNLTRNFMLEFNGALGTTNITVNAETWQADWTARLAGIDTREQNSNRDIYARCLFLGGCLQGAGEKRWWL